VGVVNECKLTTKSNRTVTVLPIIRKTIDGQIEITANI